MRVLEGSGQGEEILRAMKAASRVNKRQMRGNTVSEELIAVTGVAQHKGPDGNDGNAMEETAESG